MVILHGELYNLSYEFLPAPYNKFLKASNAIQTRNIHLDKVAYLQNLRKSMLVAVYIS
jgi:hypothetical protein